MAVPIPVLIPIALRLSALAGLTWFGTRAFQNQGDISKTARHMRKDMSDSASYLTGSPVQKIRQAAEQLQRKGGEYANLANLLISLAETIAGGNLAQAKKILEKVQLVLSAYTAFDTTRKAEVDKEIDGDLESMMNEASAGVMRAKGLSIVNDGKGEGLSIGEFLSRHYLGLYYIGRSGGRLTAEDVDSRANTLCQWHLMAGPRKYKELAEWYKSVAVCGHPDPLLPLLRECDLVKSLNVDPRYIACALNQKDATLSFEGILEDLLDRFPS